MADAEKERGNAAFAAGDYKTGVEAYSAAIELDPENAVFFSNRSACYAKLKEYQKAFEDAEACISLKRTWSKGYSRKGCALFELRRYKEAIEVYKQAIQYSEVEKEKAQFQKDIQRCEKQQKASSLLSGGPLDVVLLTLNVAVPLCALFSFISGAAFYWCMRITIANALINIYMAIGKPKFNKEYAAQVFAHAQTHRLLMAATFLFANPNFLPTLTHAVHSGMWVAQWAKRRLPTLKPDLWALVSGRVKQATSHTYEVSLFTAQMEVSLGFFLIVELLLPTRNFLVVVMYWQMLRMRYTIQQINPHGQHDMVLAFSAIRMKLDSWILEKSWVPSILKTVYTKIVSFISSTADPRAQQEQMSSMTSKCTIS